MVSWSSSKMILEHSKKTFWNRFGWINLHQQHELNFKNPGRFNYGAQIGELSYENF